MSGPSGDRLIRVDMTSQTVNIEPFPDDWKLLGGRGLSAKILLAECDPECDPLGEGNVLVMAPGVSAEPRHRPRDGSRSAARARSRTASRKRMRAASPAST